MIHISKTLYLSGEMQPWHTVEDISSNTGPDVSLSHEMEKL